MQAVEVAAAAEPGNALVPLGPSWKRQHQDACLPSLHTNALQDQADTATTAVAAPALHLAVAPHLSEQTADDPNTRLGGNVAASSSFEVKDSQAPLTVFHPAVQRPSQQNFTMVSPLPEQASKGAQLASRADAERAVHSGPFEGLANAPSLTDSGGLVTSCLPDQLCCWEQQAQAGSRPATGQPGQVEVPTSMLPVLQSPFAAVAVLPVCHQPTQTAAAQETPLASASGQHLDPQVPSPLTGTEAAAQAAIQAHPPRAQQSLLGQPKMLQQQQKLHRERLLPGLAKKAQSTIRLPLSPSSVRSNGETSVLQPLAKGQARSLHPGSNSKPQSLHPLRDCKLSLKASQHVCHSELLPGRNVVVSKAGVTDLALLLIPPSQWCW